MSKVIIICFVVSIAFFVITSIFEKQQKKRLTQNEINENN